MRHQRCRPGSRRPRKPRPRRPRRRNGAEEGRAEEGCGEGCAEEGHAEEGCGEGCAEDGHAEEGRADEEQGRDREDGVRQEERADQDRCQEGDGQEWQRDADGREAPGSLISAARPARSPRKCCERDRDHDDTIGQGRRQLDADMCGRRIAVATSFGADVRARWPRGSERRGREPHCRLGARCPPAT